MCRNIEKKGPVTGMTQANAYTYIQSTTIEKMVDIKTTEVGTVEVGTAMR